MSELGDLTNLFHASIPNLDWLDVDESAYRELEKLPKQNLNILPDLENMWSTHDKGPVYFVPNLDLSVFPEIKPQEKTSSSDLIRVVSKHVKNKMMAGWGGERVAAWIQEHVDPKTIQLCIPTFRKLAEEQGLLGTVYIDATQWDRCDQGEGEKIAKAARHAKYVLANEAKCSGCTFNVAGKCGKFRKELIFDVVPYSDTMVGEYASALKTTAPSIVSSDPKAQIRAIASMARQERVVQPDHKPTMGPQEKRQNLSRTYDPPSTEFANSSERSLYRDLSQKMMVAKGKFSDSVRARIASAMGNVAIETLRSEENLLGNIYVRPDQFDTCHKANDALRKHHNTAAYVLEIPNKCQKCSFHRAGSCSLLGKKVVKDVPYTKEFLANELHRLTDEGKITAKVAHELQARADRDPVHDLVREAYSFKKDQRAVYSGRDSDLVNMGSATAPKRAHTDEGTIPHSLRPVVMATYRAVYDGLEGLRLQSEIVGRFGPGPVCAAAENISQVVAMAGVLGNVVLDLRGFKSPSDARAYLASKGMRPGFLLREGCCNNCQDIGHDAACPSHQFPKMTVIPETGLDEIPADFVASRIDKLESRGTLTASVASRLRDRIGEEPAVDILRLAYTAGPVRHEGPYRLVKKASRLPDEKVHAELRRAADETTAEGQKKLSNLIEREYTSGHITEQARDTFVANIGKYAAKTILEKLEHYKLARVTPSTFSPTDVGTQLSHMGDKRVAAAQVSDTQRRELRTRVAQAMNRGHYGDTLKRFIRNSFTPDLVAEEKAIIASLLGEQGLMGHHYIDPRPYKACEAGAKAAAEAPAIYVKEMKKCVGCVHRNANNRCGIYGRKVVQDVPYPDGREEMQEAILNPVVVAPVTLDSVNVNPVDEFDVGGLGMDIEFDPERDTSTVDVGFDDPLGNLG